MSLWLLDYTTDKYMFSPYKWTNLTCRFDLLITLYTSICFLHIDLPNGHVDLNFWLHYIHVYVSPYRSTNWTCCFDFLITLNTSICFLHIDRPILHVALTYWLHYIQKVEATCPVDWSIWRKHKLVYGVIESSTLWKKSPKSSRYRQTDY